MRIIHLQMHSHPKVYIISLCAPSLRLARIAKMRAAHDLFAAERSERSRLGHYLDRGCAKSGKACMALMFS